MKTLIKQYSVPQVDKNILKLTLQKRTKEKIRASLASYVFLSVVLLIFVQHLIILNISYFDILISVGGGINVYILVLLNLFIGTIHFIFQNPIFIIGSSIIYYIINLYAIKIR